MLHEIEWCYSDNHSVADNNILNCFPENHENDSYVSDVSYCNYKTFPVSTINIVYYQNIHSQIFT